MKRASASAESAAGGPLSRLGRRLGEWKEQYDPLIPAGQMDAEMRVASVPTLSFFVLLGFSAAIATFGLLANSAPAIIGAMIIAPLMTPIMGLSYGVVQLSWRQIARSAITVCLGILLVLAIGFWTARFIEIKVAGTEMVSRAFPSLLDLGVAMAAGAAGAFSLSRESVRSSIAGVAISVSLVPPLAVAGIGMALGRKATADVGLSFRDLGFVSGGTDIAVGAFVLFLTNLAAIVIVAGTVMSLQGYARWGRGFLGVVGVVLASLLLMQPLSAQMERLRVKSMALRLVKTLPATAGQEWHKATRLESLSVHHVDDVLHIDARGTMSRADLPDAQQRLDLFRQELEARVGEPVVLEIEIFPIDLHVFRSPPGPEDSAVDDKELP